MKEVKRKWDLISKGKREMMLREIITFFKEDRDEEIGLIAAEGVLDFFLENTAIDIYNKGVDDAKNLLKIRFNDLEVDLDLLK